MPLSQAARRVLRHAAGGATIGGLLGAAGGSLDPEVVGLGAKTSKGGALRGGVAGALYGGGLGALAGSSKKPDMATFLGAYGALSGAFIGTGIGGSVTPRGDRKNRGRNQVRGAFIGGGLGGILGTGGGHLLSKLKLTGSRYKNPRGRPSGRPSGGGGYSAGARGTSAAGDPTVREAASTFGVNLRKATQKDMKRAYRKAMSGAHPDRGGTEEGAKAVNAAWEALKNSAEFARAKVAMANSMFLREVWSLA